MAKKCGFLDCNNPAEKGKNDCRTCQEREENYICSACRQREKSWTNTLVHQESFAKRRNTYQFLSKLRSKVPARFQAPIDQLLPKVKLDQSAKEVIEKLEKIILDYLAEKGGKQDNIRWFKYCSVCNPETIQSFMEKNYFTFYRFNVSFFNSNKKLSLKTNPLLNYFYNLYNIFNKKLNTGSTLNCKIILYMKWNQFLNYSLNL